MKDDTKLFYPWEEHFKKVSEARVQGIYIGVFCGGGLIWGLWLLAGLTAY